MTTKEKLMEAALQLFGENGYAATSTRDICQRAGVNSASIGYHFGDKRSLYRAVLRSEIEQSGSLQPSPPGGTAEDMLLHIVTASLRDVFSSREGPKGSLALREIANPSEDLMEMLKTRINAQFDRLLDCLRQIAPADTPEDTLILAALSVSGQIQYYRVFHRFLPHLVGEQRLTDLTPEVIARHIADFSISALKN